MNRVICGITEDTESSHIVRATLDAVCFQVRDVVEAMNKDYGSTLQILQVNLFKANRRSTRTRYNVSIKLMRQQSSANPVNYIFVSCRSNGEQILK